MSIFRGDKDQLFLKGVARELIEKVVGEKITYYPISKQNSPLNIYNESKEKIYDPPVELYGIISWKDQEIKTDRFGQDIIYFINVFLLEEYLVQVEVLPREGDVVEYDNKKFEITQISQPQPIFGKSRSTLGRDLTCRSIRESHFQSSVSASLDRPKDTSPDSQTKVSNFYDDVTFPNSSSIY